MSFLAILETLNFEFMVDLKLDDFIDFYLKENFGVVKQSKNVIFGNFGDSEL